MTKQEFFDRPEKCYFADDTAGIAAYCLAHRSEEAAHAVYVADLACERCFLFDMKYDPNRTYSPVSYAGERMDWLRIPAEDTEFLWQLNRHKFFMFMGQAYALTGDEKYTRAFLELAEDWLDSVKLCDDTRYGPWRSLEVGLRGEYWCKAIHLFRHSPLLTDSFVDKFHAGMKQHARYLMECHSPYRYISNWGIMENHGLFDIALCLPQDDDTREYARFALRNLEVAARMQIFPDGVHWEQSPMYHNEVLHCLFDVVILARRNGITLPEALEEGVRRMSRANLAWIKPDGHQFMTGDSDSNDIRDMLGAAACLYDDRELRFAGTPVLSCEFLWDMGLEAAVRYENMIAAEPSFASVYLEHSGHTCLRSGWGEDANVLHMCCGTMGAGHGHSDKLHIDLVLGGKDVLTDGGRFTYVYGDDRREFKDPTGHNTITVDDRLFTVTSQTWEYSKMCQPVRQGFRALERCELIQAGHLGYIDLPDGVFVNRKVVWIKPDIYVIFDEMYTAGEHSYRQYWHFDSRGRVELENAGGQRRAVYSTNGIKAQMLFLSDVDAETIPSRMARQYGRAEERTCVRCTARAKGFCGLITVISGCADISARRVAVNSALKCSTYPPHMAEAAVISAYGREYVVAVCHQEVSSPTDMIEVEGCMGYGSVIVFDKDENSLAGDVLCY